MADTQVNVGALEKWQSDVNAELEQVDKVLERVGKITAECDEDDTIYGVFKKMGEGIADAYLGLAKAYRETMEATGGIINAMKKGLANIGELIQKTADKFHL